MAKQVKTQVKRTNKPVVTKVVRGRGRPTKATMVVKEAAPEAKATKVVRKRTPKVVAVVAKQREEFEVIGDCGVSAPDVIIDLNTWQAKNESYVDFASVAHLIV